MPFYDLQPQEPVVRAEFSTFYTKSTEERKHNIYLASKSLDNTFVDINAEFSFNYTVGSRTAERGYKPAKIIVKGQFVDGVGGGVCQVSTTLYNALLLSGLQITEFHPHSLPVSYVAPSFDAMVNSNYADLRFINNTHNPIIIKTKTDGNKLTIQIIGEPLKGKYIRKSVIKEEIAPPSEQIIQDVKGEYPELYKGEFLFLSYSKKGIKSEGYLIKKVDGVTVSSQKIRTDTYNAMQGVVIEGMQDKPDNEISQDETQE